jgi:hypothetical protein
MSKQSIEDILADYQRNKNKESNLAKLIISLFAVLLTIPSSLLRGWVINLYWGWFITLIFNVPAPGTLLCTALYFMWNLPKGVYYKNVEELEEASNADAGDTFKVSVSNVVLSVLYSLSAGFFGWILHLLTS